MNNSIKTVKMLKKFKKEENFKNIPGYEGYYMCSDQGNIKSLEKLHEWNGVIRTLPERELKKQKTPQGYETINLSKKGVRKRYSVHELVLLTFIGPRPNKYDINHINCIKNDNRLINLEYCTRSENVKHAWENGLFPKKQNKRITFGARPKTQISNI